MKEENSTWQKNRRLLETANSSRKANPSWPVGPALKRGLNIMEFCKAFNANTQTWSLARPAQQSLLTTWISRSLWILKPRQLHFF